MRLVLTVLLSLWFALPAVADETEVDLELILMVDVSRSMSPAELEIQRQGYAAALRSDAIHTAIRTGMLQRIALSYVEWAGTQEVIVDWTLVESLDDLDAFAERISTTFNPALRRTSISEALAFAADSIRNNRFVGLRRVIDISGDGPNNQGRPVLGARDRVLSEGIIINGLPLMTRDGMGSQWHLDDLDVYYEACVTGGPGSFVIAVLDWKDFAEAVRRKLVLEIAGLPMIETVQPVQFTAPATYDCLIGEKLWEQRRLYGFP